MIRRWMPDGWAPRWRRQPPGGEGSFWSALVLPSLEEPVGAVAVAIVVIGLVAVTVVVLPVFVLIVEAIVVVAALVGRLVLRRPWRIVARTRSAPAESQAWHVVGFLRSRRVMHEIRTALRDGQPLEPGEATPVLPRSPDH